MGTQNVPGEGTDRTNPALAHGLDLVTQGMEELLHGTAAPLSQAELVHTLRALEVAVRKVPAVQHQLITQCAEQNTATALGHRNLTSLLHQVLRISEPDARARIRAAEHRGPRSAVRGPRRTLTGQPLPPRHPVTAAAQHDGLIGGERAQIITTVLRKIPTNAGPDVYARAEHDLVTHACTTTPEQLTVIGHRLLAHIDLDGSLTDHTDRARRRGLGLGRQGVDLMSGISGTLTPACRAKLDAALATLARPGAPTGGSVGTRRALSEAEPDADAVRSDTRTQSQRNHDALQALCDLALTSGQLGTHRGLPTTVILTMTLEQLEHAAGQVTTASGGLLPITDALTMAEHAHPVLVLFDHDGRPLHLGRSRRLANADQRLARIATDRGCTKPSCIQPADRCQTHHSTDWAKDGRTDVDQLVLVCDGDHAGVNDSAHGWRTEVGGDPRYPGRCAWTAPRHIDPQQVPRVNRYHHPDELLRDPQNATDEPP